MSWAALLPAALLPLLALLARRQMGSWAAPGAFFALAWAGFIWAALLIAPDFHVFPVAIWVVAGGVVAVFLGALVGAGLWLAPIPRTADPVPPLPGLRTVSIAGALLGLVGLLVLLRSLGQSPLLFFSPTELGALASKVASARYEEAYVEPFVTRLLMTGTYFSVLMGGCAAGLGRIRTRSFAAWGGLLPAIGITAVTTTRATVLFCLVLWCGAFLAGGLFVQRDFGRLVTRRGLLWGGIALPLIVAGAALSQLSRYGLGIDGTLYVLDRLRIWIVGFLAGFGTWLEQSGTTDLGTGGGAFTLAGAYNLLGIATRSLGLFTDRVTIADGYEVNIYTIFRSLLQDFGMLGGLLALMLFGAVGGAAYGGVRRGRLTWLPVLAIFYALILFSHITSLFNYNSIVLAWVAFLLTLPAMRLYGRLGLPARS